MKKSTILTICLTALLLALLLGGCSAAPAPAAETPAPESPAAESAGAELPPAESPAATESPAPTEEPQPRFEELVGRWTESEKRAELWIQYTEGEKVVFSLLIPGSAAINNAVADQTQGGSFRYEDSYQQGVSAAGSLLVEDGMAVLRLTESDLLFPAGTELRFPERSFLPDFAELYAPILDAYREHQARGGGLTNWYADEPGYVHVGLYDAEEIGYQYWDLDLNGVPELILGAVYSPEETAGDEPGEGLYWHNLVLDLYTLDRRVPRYIVNSGDRYRYSLTSDGLFYYEGSSGAAYSDVAVYELREGLLCMVTGISMDGDSCYMVDGFFNPEHEGYRLITEEEFYWLWDKYRNLYLYERFAPLQLRPLE